MSAIGSINKSIRLPLLHPYMFTLFSIMFLYSRNVGQLDISSVLIFAAYALIAVAVFHILLHAIFKDRYKASLLLTVALVIFFSHGHVLELIWGWELKGILIGRNLYLLLTWGGLFCLAVFTVFRASKLQELNKIVSVFTIGLLAIVSLDVVRSQLRIGAGDAVRTDMSVNAGAVGKPVMTLPDIYYIILDGYTSQRNLKKYFDFDNTEFADFLLKKNFVVSSATYSNYATTFLSLTSSLNMNYLNEYFSRYETDPKIARQLAKMVENNAVITELKKKGYKLVHLSSGYGSTNYNRFADWNISSGRLNEFARMVVHSSLLRTIEDRLVEGDSRNRILRSFDMIGEVQHKIEGPRFVFAHIVSPHPPYLFDAKGNPVNNTPAGLKDDGLEMWLLKKPYVEQVRFVNSKIQHLVTRVLAEATVPPIIIIQGDHGSASTGGWENPSDTLIAERLGIFSAIYLPGKINKKPHASISPVNTFRYIFNNYLGTHFEMLPDRMYFSTYDANSKLRDVTDILSNENK